MSRRDDGKAYERHLRRRREQHRARRRRRNRILAGSGSAAAAIGLALGLFFAFRGGGTPVASPTPSIPSTPIPGCDTPTSEPPKGLTFPKAPAMTIDRTKTYTASMRTTCGTIVMNLQPKLAPKTVNSFVFLAKKGFYGHTVFHRVQSEASFAIVQGGDPTGTGSGGPGYKYTGEKPPAGTKYLRGVVAMANSGDTSTNGSQFFFVVHDWKELPANYTVFAKVTDRASLATLDRMIKAKGTPLQGGLGLHPSPDIQILSVTIKESR
jgi:peptidyl-prolyl cis-trans isomerase B (cyclophilin B)